MVGLCLFGFLPPGLVRGCPDAGTLLTFIPIDPAEMLWKILANFNRKHFSLFFLLSFLGTHPHFIYDSEANKVEILPAAGGGNGDPHTTTRLPGVLSKRETQVKGQMTKLSVGTWAALVSPARREGRGKRGSLLSRGDEAIKLC